MGMPALLTQTGTGRSSIWYPDWLQDPFNIGIGCIATGTVTYNIEHAFDDPQKIAVGSFTWFQNSGINGVVNANANGNYQFPVRAISINITSGTGTVTANLIQATFPR